MVNYLKGLAVSDSVSFTYSVNYEDIIQTYTVRYTSNTVEVTDKYQINYTSYQTIQAVDRYIINYSSIYGDSAQQYRIRYFSNRNPQEVVDRYYVRYTSSNPNNTYDLYSIRYTSVGAFTEAKRVRYKIRYTSDSAGDFSQTYKIKYTTSSFYENFHRYTIRYSTTGAEEILTRAILLRNQDTTDALFELRGVLDKPLDSYLFVFSNMPKYQTVEYLIGDSLPYITYYTASDLAEMDLFDLVDGESYYVKGYLLLKDIEDLNGLSLDVFDISSDYSKINRSKTYFFGLESTDYLETFLSLKGTTYYYINRSSANYNAKYLNYVSAAITPSFRFGSDCCFSRKINKTNYSYCSPF